jgi:hypothetical protein
MKMITLPNTDRKLHEAMGDLNAALHGVEGAIKGEVPGDASQPAAIDGGPGPSAMSPTRGTGFGRYASG